MHPNPTRNPGKSLNYVFSAKVVWELIVKGFTDFNNAIGTRIIFLIGLAIGQPGFTLVNTSKR